MVADSSSSGKLIDQLGTQFPEHKPSAVQQTQATHCRNVNDSLEEWKEKVNVSVDIQAVVLIIKWVCCRLSKHLGRKSSKAVTDWVRPEPLVSRSFLGATEEPPYREPVKAIPLLPRLPPSR
ncbi:hypothetical protein LWI28_021955 [Acer negundo]|uniref:Uncharacterized protein n=1 Tax=Acer negundo TaxID=4023 RepID=A0AAD5IBA1_ACENE|nr:hypothetical protein LWI28_021955 [Acer negundo]